jgi:hypothetical protein
MDSIGFVSFGTEPVVILSWVVAQPASAATTSAAVAHCRIRFLNGLLAGTGIALS